MYFGVRFNKSCSIVINSREVEMSYGEIVDELTGFYKIIRLMPLRKTEGVYFDTIPVSVFGRIDAIDRVVHAAGAFSPGAVGEVARPWYMHEFQDDHLMVLSGMRVIDLYSRGYAETIQFEITPDTIKKNGRVIFRGQGLIMWPRGVFHRVESCREQGSSSLNFAVHYPGFDIATNFNIYDLNVSSGEYHVIRHGMLDQ